MAGEGWIEKLRATLARRERGALERRARAAVLVPILDDQGPLRLLLTRRTHELPTHQGQVAFPGGHVHAADRDIVGTALREAEEEIGLAPDRVEVLGLLDDFLTHDGAVAVTPIVGRVAALPVLSPRPGEVARVFAIPVADLADPARWAMKAMVPVPGAAPVRVFHHDGEILWGLSARVVAHLLLLAEG
jgi:8-oxo-dGTP pyrophosphatase MutT (NUDIX family)